MVWWKFIFYNNNQFFLGPRLTLSIIKIEEGFQTGRVIYHAYRKKKIFNDNFFFGLLDSKTEQEILELEQKKIEKEKLKKQRKEEQESNIKKKEKNKELEGFFIKKI